MSRIRAFVNLLVCISLPAFLLSGCGGGSVPICSSSFGGLPVPCPQSTPTPSHFAGTWRGQVTDQANAQQLTTLMTVDTQGNLSGQVTNTLGQTGSVSGTLGNDGSLFLRYSLGSQSYQGGALVQLAANGHLVSYTPAAPLAPPSALTLILDLAKQ